MDCDAASFDIHLHGWNKPVRLHDGWQIFRGQDIYEFSFRGKTAVGLPVYRSNVKRYLGIIMLSLYFCRAR